MSRNRRLGGLVRWRVLSRRGTRFGVDKWFFVAAEFSLVAVRQSRIEQLVAEGNGLASAVQRAVRRLDTYLAATQLGITMASLGLGWIGEPALVRIIDPALAMLPESWASAGSHVISIAISFLIITVLHIVLGELAPKSLALQRTEPTALAVSKPLEVFVTLFRPAIWVLNGAGNAVIRLIGLKPASGEEMAHSAEELRYLVTASCNAGVLDEVESEMIARTFDFGETRVHTLMVPRTEIVAVETQDSMSETLDRMVNSGYSRLPVYEGDLDRIVGIVHLRDLVRHQRQGVDLATPVEKLMREPLVVPESCGAESILGDMQRLRTQIAIVVDEHGGTGGLVTMEDLLEEIVGDMQDEFEIPHESVRSEGDGSKSVDGLLAVGDFDERFSIELPSGDYDTLGGFMMAELGRVPQKGDVVVLGRLRLTVTAMDGRRVATVRVDEVKDESPDIAQQTT